MLLNIFYVDVFVSSTTCCVFVCGGEGDIEQKQS